MRLSIVGASVATLSGLGGLYRILIAYDIDPSGTTIVGSSTLATGEQSAWVDTGTGANALPSLGGDSSIANKVTSSGLIGGSARTPSGEMHFVTWQAGAITDHGNLDGNYANLVELNEAGQFIGSIGYPMVGDHTVFWDGSTLVDLGTLGGILDKNPGDMNEAGDVVVSSRTAGGQTHAALWDSGLLVDLGTLRQARIHTPAGSMTRARSWGPRIPLAGGSTASFFKTASRTTSTIWCRRAPSRSRAPVRSPTPATSWPTRVSVPSSS